MSQIFERARDRAMKAFEKTASEIASELSLSPEQASALRLHLVAIARDGFYRGSEWMTPFIHLQAKRKDLREWASKFYPLESIAAEEER